MEKRKRTRLDFSEHVLTETNLRDENTGVRCDIYTFAIPDTSIHKFVFINTHGTLTVTGDYGNWVFCREFHPSEEGYVSDSYWCEKLHISSVQEIAKYSSEETKEALEELIETGLEEYYGEGYKNLNKMKKPLKELLSYVDDELEYTYHAYRDYDITEHIDYDMIPFVKKINPRLDYIFDAFDEMCERKKSL